MDWRNQERSMRSINNHGISLKKVQYLKVKEPDQIVLCLFEKIFGLENYLEIDQMGEKLVHDFTFVLVKSFECNSMPLKLTELSNKIAESNFFKTILYNTVDINYNFQLIKLAIKLLKELLNANEYNVNLIDAMKNRLELKVMHRIQNEELRTLFDEFLNFEREIVDKLSKKKNKTFQNIENDFVESDEDFTTISIVPSLDDIMNNQESVLRKNITNGSYENVHHYLDVHFRLLREDFMRPLRESIYEFKEIVQKHKKGSVLTREIINRIKKIQNISTYFDVFCNRVSIEKQGIVYVMQLDKENVKKINWETSKRLIYGSLVCLSSDYFLNECFVGIVCERDEKELREKGCFNIKFDFDDRDQIKYPDIDKPYIMLETSAFFESYRHVLKALKTFKREGEEYFPFKENLVYSQNSVISIPKYLNEASVGFESLVKNWRTISASLYSISTQCFLSNHASWPTAEQMDLDQSQYEAVKLALTNKLALIQGPPGTGKTFLGVKIMKFLLDNKHSWWNRPNERHKPILMICYTNHALDQFLEYCINECKLTSGVVRIGGRSKSKNLDCFLLKNIKQKLRNDRSIDKSIHFSIKRQNEIILNCEVEISTILKKLDLIFNHHAILTIQELFNHISSNHFDQLINYSRYENKIRNVSLIEWLGLLEFDDIELSDGENGQIVTGLNEDRDFGDETTIINQEIEQINPKESNLVEDYDFLTNERMLDEDSNEVKKNEIFNFDTSEIIKKEDLFEMVKDCEKTLKRNTDGLEWKIRKGNKIKDAKQTKFEKVLEKIFHTATKQYTKSDFDLLENCANIWTLGYNHRYALYFYWIQSYKKKQDEKIRNLYQQYNIEAGKLQELRLQEDKSIMQDAYIIAMTTTGSSRYQSVLKDIGSRIVIVEEAAEVFEAHIVSSLSKHCEHLILIGDHKQLRPNPAVYTLATQYHLDVSLFERLINNDIKRVMLTNQHRMRPEISILMKHFYEEKILNDQSVHLYPSIKGLRKNIFFINHNHLENRTVDNTTKYNTHEAEYLTELSLYLVKQGYDQSKITILTMYLGQFSEIKKKLRSLKLNLIKLSTVDNFQGEENEIILLSLVRSNLESKIGFLSIKNRVCVALSRAKHGLFVIGNFEFIVQSEKKNTWRNLLETIKSNGYYGRSLSLTCGSHPQNDIDAIQPSDFNKRPDGGCLLPCNYRLKCGHVCSHKCHGNYDQAHVLFECKKNCDKKIERCGHLCKQICSSKHDCNKCGVEVVKEIKECCHMIKFRCDLVPTRKDCLSDCEKILSCGHKCTKKCQEIDCGECLTKIKVKSNCVHKSILTVYCSEPKWTYLTKCEVLCDEILECGHKCSGTCGSCYGGLIHKSCAKKCDRMLFCGHKCSVPCSTQCEPCKNECENECIHSKCKKLCSEPCANCMEKCSNSCSHSECTKLCHELCDRKPCDEPCDKMLECGHLCIGLCGEICPPWCRLCHKNKVCQLLFGNKDEPDARFIFLNDCKHLIEVSAMDHWINSKYSDFNNNSLNLIQLPECPKCKTPLRRSKRYSNVIKSQLKAINQIKLKHFEDKTENSLMFRELNEQVIAHNLDLKKKKDQFVVENVKNKLRENLSFNCLAAIKNTWNIYLRIKKIKKTIKDNGLDEFIDKKKYLKFEINKIYEALKTDRNELLMLKDGQKFREISLELERITSILELERMRKFANLAQNAVVIIFDLENSLVNKPVRFDKISDKIQKLFNELAQLLRTELVKEEKLMIINAIGLSHGHWYKCPNGHVYCIGECVGARQKSICPECKAKIDGLKLIS